jgi:CubicO group peptidase (beta-lactamase class C family)
MRAIVEADHVVLPSAGAGAEGSSRPLPPAGLGPGPDAVAGARVATGGTVADVLERYRAVGLVVLHRGRLAYQWFRPGSDPARRHVCYSVTKSFTGTLAALAVHDGVLDRSARIGDVLPELAAAGIADATVGQVADMTASIAYGEDYLDAGAGPSAGEVAGFGDYIAALAPGGGGPRGLLARIGPGSRPHGVSFDYATPLTDVLGWAVERVRGRPYAELVTEAIWSHVGAEHDATLAVAPDGTPLLGIGLAMTTRDLARAGLVWAEGRHLPGAVIESMRTGDPGAFARGGHYAYLTGYAYRDQWWLPGGPARPLSAWGVYGQLLWVEPENGLVVALHSDGPDASDPQRDLAHDALCRALSGLAADAGS